MISEIRKRVLLSTEFELIFLGASGKEVNLLIDSRRIIDFYRINEFIKIDFNKDIYKRGELKVFKWSFSIHPERLINYNELMVFLNNSNIYPF